MNRLSKISLSFSLGLAIASAMAAPSMAQTNDDDVYQDNESSSILGGDENFNPFDLIHNSRLNNGRNAEQFQKESDRNIDNAAADYRQNLLDYFRQQQAETAAETANTETPVDTETAQP